MKSFRIHTEHGGIGKFGFRFFYSWIASVIAANIAVLVTNLVTFGNLSGVAVPQYANAMLNIAVRFPLWAAFTFIITVILVITRETKLSSWQKSDLVLINGLTWILSGILFLILYLAIPINWDLIITLPAFIITGF